MTTKKDTLAALATNRVEEAEIKAQGPDKLGEETTTIMPEDIILMFSGKLVNKLLKQKVAASNMIYGLTKAYGEIYTHMEENLNAEKEEIFKAFDKAKVHLERVASQHPLSKSLCRIKGFTAYQLALVVAEIKDIARFATPSKLMVYSGCAEKYGLKVCKMNLNKIRKIHHERYTGDPKDYKEFGFNTSLSGRMHVIAENLIRQKGWFYEFYKQVRQRLEQRAMNNGEVFQATAEDAKGTKMKAGQYYMKNRKCQSIIAWSHANAMNRVKRTILHFIYSEWRTLRGLPVRVPYPLDYLGHNNYISLEEVIAWEENN